MPVFRTAQDVEKELAVAKRLEEALSVNVTVHEDALFNHYDMSLYDAGRLVAIAELKCRTNPSTKFPTLFLAKRKYDNLMRHANELSKEGAVPVVPYFMALFDDDVLKIINLRRVDISRLMTEVSGRLGHKNRGVKNDIELMYHLPISDMLTVVPGLRGPTTTEVEVRL